MVQLALFGGAGSPRRAGGGSVGAGAGAGSCAGAGAPAAPAPAGAPAPVCELFARGVLSECASCPHVRALLGWAVPQWSGSLHSRGFRSLLAGVLGRVSAGAFLSVGRVSVGGGRGFSAVRCSCSGFVFQFFSGSLAGSFRVLPSSSSFLEGV